MRYSAVAFCAMLAAGLDVSAQADVLSSPHGQAQMVRQAQHTALCGLQAQLVQAGSDAAVAVKLMLRGLTSPQDAATAIANARRVSGCLAGPAS